MLKLARTTDITKMLREKKFAGIKTRAPSAIVNSTGHGKLRLQYLYLRCRYLDKGLRMLVFRGVGGGVGGRGMGSVGGSTGEEWVHVTVGRADVWRGRDMEDG